LLLLLASCTFFCFGTTTVLLIRPESSSSLPLLDGSCTQGCFSTDLDFLFLLLCSPLLERARFFDSAGRRASEGLFFLELEIFSLSLGETFLVSFFNLARSFEEEDSVDETELLESDEEELTEEVSDSEDESDSESLESDEDESFFLRSPSGLLLKMLEKF
jgi:hypothetical protein